MCIILNYLILLKQIPGGDGPFLHTGALLVPVAKVMPLLGDVYNIVPFVCWPFLLFIKKL